MRNRGLSLWLPGPPNNPSRISTTLSHGFIIGGCPCYANRQANSRWLSLFILPVLTVAYLEHVLTDLSCADRCRVPTKGKTLFRYLILKGLPAE